MRPSICSSSFAALHRAGIVLLYISHRLQELQEIADVVSVLRNGEVAGTIGIRRLPPQRLPA